MKRLFLYAVIVISIPFFVIIFFYHEEKIKEINLKYVSNVIVRVKRSNGNIDRIPLEEYVVGVVAGEMPVTFHKEALKAQAVASRSYVLKRLGNNSEYDVVDTVSNQVYLDERELKDRWKDKYVEYINNVRNAVNETSMEYLEYSGEVIDAMFFSTSNGYTEDVSIVFNDNLPYLKSVESKYDEEVSPAFNNIDSMSLQEFYDRLGISYNKNLNVEVIDKSSSNRVIKLKINGKEFMGKDIYNKLGLRSLDFSIKLIDNNVEIRTCGYGHGVGMSQYGAEGMAINGFSYKDILAHYYVGTSLKKYI